jgi:hypothetical protein
MAARTLTIKENILGANAKRAEINCTIGVFKIPI